MCTSNKIEGLGLIKFSDCTVHVVLTKKFGFDFIRLPQIKWLILIMYEWLQPLPTLSIYVFNNYSPKWRGLVSIYILRSGGDWWAYIFSEVEVSTVAEDTDLQIQGKCTYCSLTLREIIVFYLALYHNNEYK